MNLHQSGDRCACVMASAFLLLCGCLADAPVDLANFPPMATLDKSVLKKASLAAGGVDEAGNRIDSVRAVKALLVSGFPVDLVIDEYGWNLLHLAVIYKDARLVRFLLDCGADKSVRDDYGYLPIDIAFKDDCPQICRMLALDAEPVDNLIDGIPEGALEAFFRDNARTNGPVMFISGVNGAAPSTAFTNWVSSCAIKMTYRMGAPVESISTASWEKDWIAKDTGDEAVVTCLTVERLSSKCYRMTEVGGSPFSRGFFLICEVSKKYGYWFCKRIDAGEFFHFPPAKQDAKSPSG